MTLIFVVVFFSCFNLVLKIKLLKKSVLTSACTCTHVVLQTCLKTNNFLISTQQASIKGDLNPNLVWSITVLHVIYVHVYAIFQQQEKARIEMLLLKMTG